MSPELTAQLINQGYSIESTSTARERINLLRGSGRTNRHLPERGSNEVQMAEIDVAFHTANIAIAAILIGSTFGYTAIDYPELKKIAPITHLYGLGALSITSIYSAYKLIQPQR